jgi:hypothetical protein
VRSTVYGADLVMFSKSIASGEMGGCTWKLSIHAKEGIGAGRLEEPLQPHMMSTRDPLFKPPLTTKLVVSTEIAKKLNLRVMIKY